jgi:two-component system OmpR family sensor kinase
VSLRGRLLALLLALVIVGLVVADVATYAALNRFLIRRIDQQLEATWRPVELAVQFPARFPNPADGPGGRAEVDVQLRNPAGVVIGTYRSRRSSETSKPQIPRKLPHSGVDPAPRANGAFFNSPTTSAGAAASPEGRPATATPTTAADSPPTSTAAELPAGPNQSGNGVLRTVGSVGGGPPWRLRISTLPNGDTLVLALPMRDVAATLHDLRWIELAVTSAVLLAAAAAGFLVVRLGLRPLDDIEETAEYIADGDLTRRVPEANPRTEVGRLAVALNAMLSQIESAFGERHASEDRLRRFVADASHELRTPLTSIRGYAELFRRGANHQPEDLSRIMRNIEEEAIRMGVLVDDLLLLARLDNGRPLDNSPVDLVKVVRQAVDAARFVDDHHPLDLDVAGEVWILGDRLRLRQVVDNLLANVRTHTPPGTPARISVSAGAGSAVLEVADEGPGLTAPQAARIFERFYRADPSRARDRGGSGLGLSIVESIVTAHGGRASAAGRPGVGCTIRITLPLRPSAVPPLTAVGEALAVSPGSV